MNTNDHSKKLSAAWLTAARLLSFRIEAPYLLKSVDGIQALGIAYLPDFGSANGMVIGFSCSPDYQVDNTLKTIAESQGLFYSFINAEIYGEYNEAIFMEALSDWGFFGQETLRPNWMKN